MKRRCAFSAPPPWPMPVIPADPAVRGRVDTAAVDTPCAEGDTAVLVATGGIGGALGTGKVGTVEDREVGAAPRVQATSSAPAVAPEAKARKRRRLQAGLDILRIRVPPPLRNHQGSSASSVVSPSCSGTSSDGDCDAVSRSITGDRFGSAIELHVSGHAQTHFVRVARMLPCRGRDDSIATNAVPPGPRCQPERLVSIAGRNSPKPSRALSGTYLQQRLSPQFGEARHAACSIRCWSKSNFVHPYIYRFSSLSRLICPSVMCSGKLH